MSLALNFLVEITPNLQAFWQGFQLLLQFRLLSNDVCQQNIYLSQDDFHLVFFLCENHHLIVLNCMLSVLNFQLYVE